MTAHRIEQQAVATIAGLSMDAPHAARSGHQGTAMALAPARPRAVYADHEFRCSHTRLG